MAPKAPKPIPDDQRGIIPYLCVDDAAAAIQFYKRAFGAKEGTKILGPDGRIGHAAIQIGDATVMLSDPFPQSRGASPKKLGGTTVAMFVYVEDVDSVVQDALDAGATATMPVDDMFWGDRFGEVMDPFGHLWQVATHKEDVAPDELTRRAEKMMAGMTS
jgi:PhnB protein